MMSLIGRCPHGVLGGGGCVSCEKATQHREAMYRELEAVRKERDELREACRAALSSFQGGHSDVGRKLRLALGEDPPMTMTTDYEDKLKEQRDAAIARAEEAEIEVERWRSAAMAEGVARRECLEDATRLRSELVKMQSGVVKCVNAIWEGWDDAMRAALLAALKADACAGGRDGASSGSQRRGPTAT